MYPDRPVFVKVYTTKAPVFTSRRSGTNVTVTGNVEVYVIAKNGAPVYALTVGLVSFVIHRKLMVSKPRFQRFMGFFEQQMSSEP